jgi:hypothetical protein
MKDKPPSPGSSSTLSTTQPVMRQRKKPHMLPPLEKRRNSVSRFCENENEHAGIHISALLSIEIYWAEQSVSQ